MFLTGGTVLVLVLVLFFFSPRWYVLRVPDPRTFQWSRGMQLLKQCDDPFRTDIEPSLHWRLLPPLVAHALGLKGMQPFGLSWLGVIAFVISILHYGERWLKSRMSALALTTIISSTSAVLVPLGWLGINDPWVWLGLLVVTLSRERWPGWIACLLCPWVDERFIIGLPLAVWCRERLRGDAGFLRELSMISLWLLPYIGIRGGWWVVQGGDSTSAQFLENGASEFLQSLSLAPLGWWLGMRAGFALGVLAIIHAVWARCLMRELALVLATAGVCVFLAHDLSRSIAIIMPWIVMGAVWVRQQWSEHGGQLLLLCAIANLLLPTAHLSGGTFDIISPLLLEVYRIL